MILNKTTHLRAQPSSLHLKSSLIFEPFFITVSTKSSLLLSFSSRSTYNSLGILPPQFIWKISLHILTYYIKCVPCHAIVYSASFDVHLIPFLFLFYYFSFFSRKTISSNKSSTLELLFLLPCANTLDHHLHQFECHQNTIYQNYK